MTKRAYTIALLALPAFALGACSKSEGNNATSSSNTSTSTTTTTTSNNSAVASENTPAETPVVATTEVPGMKMQPGEWEMKAELIDMSGPGMPPQALAAARQQLANQPARKNCLTQAQVDQMATQMVPNGGACNFTDRQTANGVLNMRGTCHAGTGNANISIQGGYDAQTMHADMTTDAPIPSGGQMHMQMRLTGHRTGECSGAAAGAADTKQ